jgi:hypothetical protein
MRSEIKDAIESACTVEATPTKYHLAQPQRHRSFDLTRAIVLAVAQELPSEMTIAELCDELIIANNQREQP